MTADIADRQQTHRRDHPHRLDFPECTCRTQKTSKKTLEQVNHPNRTSRPVRVAVSGTEQALIPELAREQVMLLILSLILSLSPSPIDGPLK